METQELRLKLVEAILTNIKGLSPDAVIDVAKKYEAYIEQSITDKVQTPVDNLKEGRIDSDVPSKKKPR